MRAFVAGCSGQIAGADAGSCTIPAGTHIEHAVAEASGPSCPSIPDQTITLNGSSTIGSSSGGFVDGGGAGCTSNIDASTCTMSISCTTAAGGYTTQTTVTLTYASDGSAIGKESLTILDGGGNVLSSCTYDLTITKT